MKLKHISVKMRLWIVLPALALVPLILGGCTVARMQIHQDLSLETEELTVTGRQGFTWGKDLTFGSFTLTDIKRGWVSSTSWGVLFWSKTKAKRKFQFTLDSPYRDDKIDVLAVTNASMQELDFGSRNWSLNMQFETDYLTVADCKIDDELWSVIMASNQQTGMLMSGIITNGQRTIKIESSRQLQGAAYEVLNEVGYHFIENDQYIGAVENINAGAVFMKRTLDSQTRNLLAIGSGVVFIYTDVLN